MKKIEIKAGQRFGRLVVIKENGKSKNGYPTYLCKCDCGKEITTRKHYLLGGRKLSCGCFARDVARETQRKNFYKHGLTGTRIFEIYRGMKKRCIYKHLDWETYGGRGIKMCEDWLGEKGPINFYNWAIESGYQDNLTIDRIDTNGNYEPSNCRWATPKEQCRNKRNTKYVEYKNKKTPLIELCEKLNVNYNKIRARIRLGWTLDEAISGKRA